MWPLSWHKHQCPCACCLPCNVLRPWKPSVARPHSVLRGRDHHSNTSCIIYHTPAGAVWPFKMVTSTGTPKTFKKTCCLSVMPDNCIGAIHAHQWGLYGGVWFCCPQQIDQMPLVLLPERCSGCALQSTHCAPDHIPTSGALLAT